MSLFSLFSKKSGAECVLLVDVGSSSVTCAFVELENKIPKILASASAEISILSDLTLSRFESEMFKSLNLALTKLRALHKTSPSRIQVYLASPWYASQVRFAKMSRPSPFVVTKAILNDMIAKELKAFEEEEINSKLKSSESIKVIESNTLRVTLNGYIHNEPIDAHAKELELSIFLAVAPMHLLKKIEEILAHDYGHRAVSFSSFVSASFIVSRDFFPHQNSYLLLDVGGEVTDVSFVKDGTLVQSTSFPKGRNFMLRRLSSELKRSISESVTLCMLYMEDKVENSIKDSCTRILDKAKKDWLDSFQKSIFAMSNELSLPDTILLTVDGDVGPWFVEIIKKEEFHEYALSGREFNIVPLDSTFFHESLGFAEAVPRNPFIMIEALASQRKK